MTQLFQDLTQFATTGQTWFWTYALVFLRVGAMMFLMPAFGEQNVPQRVRLMLALAFTAVVAPAVAPEFEAVKGLVIPAAVEVVDGLLIGIGLRLFVMALQSAGAIIAQSTSLSQLFGGATPEPQPAVGNLLSMACLALAVASGLHVKAASLMILSYQALPPGHFATQYDLTGWGIAQVAHTIALALTLSSPFVIGAGLYNVALGFINKAMPQFSVSLVGAPALAAGGLILMAIVISLVMSAWMAGFDAYLANPFSVAK